MEVRAASLIQPFIGLVGVRTGKNRNNVESIQRKDGIPRNEAKAKS
jgi:hypothetical protein